MDQTDDRTTENVGEKADAFFVTLVNTKEGPSLALAKPGDSLLTFGEADDILKNATEEDKLVLAMIGNQLAYVTRDEGVYEFDNIPISS